ncbi:MAG: hypothetical protein GEV06_04070 [Luteitalea sp.]|nr:hypothetical protein [Luteitalea sp.]
MLTPPSGSNPGPDPTSLAGHDTHRPPVQRWTPEDDEHQILDHVRLLWGRRRLVIVLTLVGGLGGLAAGLLATRAYEAQTILGVSQTQLDASQREQPADALLGTFRSILTSQAIARGIVRDFRLNQPPHEMTAAQFLIRAVTVEAIPSTTLLNLRVTLADAALAANVANAMANRSADIGKALTLEEAVQARDGIAAQVKESRENLDKIAQQLEETKKEAQVELQEKDIDAILEQRGELRELIVEAAGERAALERAEEELAKRERIQTLSRSIDADPALAEAARSSGTQSILGLTLKDEAVNPTYDKLDEEVALARARVTDLERRRTQLTTQHNLKGVSIPLLNRLYESQRRISRLETDLEIARVVYVDVATRYEQARVQVASRSARLLVIDPAVPPTVPVSRHLLRNLVLGAVAGLLLAIVYVLSSRTIAALRQAPSA